LHVYLTRWGRLRLWQRKRGEKADGLEMRQEEGAVARPLWETPSPPPLQHRCPAQVSLAVRLGNARR
jgi:hypothetical protein